MGRMSSRSVATEVHLGAVHPLQIWMHPLGICKMSKTNMLISPPKDTRHPTIYTCCLCWSAVGGKESFSKRYV